MSRRRNQYLKLIRQRAMAKAGFRDGSSRSGYMDKYNTFVRNLDKNRGEYFGQLHPSGMKAENLDVRSRSIVKKEGRKKGGGRR